MSETINTLLERARQAQKRFELFDQEQVDEVVTAVAWAVVNPENNKMLSELAVSDTGLGNKGDKFSKNYRKTVGLLQELQSAKSVGVVAEYPEKGLIEIARPVGVVGAIVPSTNPVATPTNKTMNALKGRNAIILAPSPKGDRTCETLVQLIQHELTRIGAPIELVQKLPSPASKSATAELMNGVDLVVATGSQNNVKKAYTSGTPAFGVGAGNVVSIIDETADIKQASQHIIRSKSFDNATSCSSENNLIIVESVYDTVLQSLIQNGAVLLPAEDKQLLEKSLWKEERLNPDLIAKSTAEIATYSALKTTGVSSAKILMVEETAYGSKAPFSGEKLSPILTVYRVCDFEQAKRLAENILAYQGRGHSISIHTKDQQRPLDVGLNLPVCRVIVNQAHCFAAGGSFDNGLPFSLSMGCGTWGGNNSSDNLGYRHYLNTTRISHSIASHEPKEEALFSSYWNKYQLR